MGSGLEGLEGDQTVGFRTVGSAFGIWNLEFRVWRLGSRRNLNEQEKKVPGWVLVIKDMRDTVRN